MRDNKDVYRQALIEEYEAYRRADRADDAEHVAGVLKDYYGHDVTGDGETAEKATPEHTAAEKPPETATPPKPARPKPARAKKPAGE